MAIFKKPSLKTESKKKREMPQGLWRKCPGCGAVVHEIELAENDLVCPRCDYHFTQSARERIAHLCDAESFVELDHGLSSIDTLKFQGMASYKDRLRKYQDSTGLVDAVLSGHAKIEGHPVAIAVMDFSFLAATMGSVRKRPGATATSSSMYAMGRSASGTNASRGSRAIAFMILVSVTPLGRTWDSTMLRRCVA